MAGGHTLHETHPIIITIVDGPIGQAGVLASCAFIDRVLRKRKLNKIYWVVDASKAVYSRQTAIQMAEITQNAIPGSGGDPRVVPLVIMSVEKYAVLDSEMKNRYCELEYPLFSSLHDAYTFALFLSSHDKN